MNDLQQLADRYHISIESLRHFAFTSCGIPQDAPQHLVDLWLYEHLGLAVNVMGRNFNPRNDVGLQHAILFSHPRSEFAGSFEERCAASWAELVANPLNRHGIRQIKPLFWAAHASTGSEFGDAEHGEGLDLNPFAYIETANTAPTDPA